MAVHRSATLCGREEVGLQTQLYTFDTNEDLGFTGGQYIILNSGMKDAEGNDIKRAYSLMSPDYNELDTQNNNQRRFQICVKAIDSGVASNYLPTLKIGTELKFSGPWGKFIKNPDWPKQGRTLFFATDTALTVILGLINSIKFKDVLNQCYFVWLRSDSNYFVSNDFVISRIPNGYQQFQILDIAPPGQAIRISESQKIIEIYLEKHGIPTNVFLAGDGYVLQPLKELLESRGVISDSIGIEAFFNKVKEASAPLPPGYQKSGITGKMMPIKEMREGFTTGACSAAAAKAATRAIVSGKLLTQIESTLPNHQKTIFALNKCEINLQKRTAVCSVIKDAGDDPDATHGAELTAEVRLLNENIIHLKGGDGVAIVTKAGLGLEVGGPAINPIPRKNITEMVLEELQGSDYLGAEITISVPGGQEMAKKTLNSRLGLIGGISILGTTGIVKPYSTAAYRASVVQGIQVAKEQGMDTVVLTTGGKSEKYAMDILKGLDIVAFVQVGDFVGAAIKACVKFNIQHVVIVGMIGKLSKMAEGRMMTHAAGSEVNISMLADLVRSLGASPEICHQVEKANTARHVLELCQSAGVFGITTEICKRVVSALRQHASNNLKISCFLVDFNGTLLGQFKHPDLPYGEDNFRKR